MTTEPTDAIYNLLIQGWGIIAFGFAAFAAVGIFLKGRLNTKRDTVSDYMKAKGDAKDTTFNQDKPHV